MPPYFFQSLSDSEKIPFNFFYKTNKNLITKTFGINLPNVITTKFLPIIGRNLVVITFGKLIVGLNKQRARRLLEIWLNQNNYHIPHKICKGYKIASGSSETSWKICSDWED